MVTVQAGSWNAEKLGEFDYICSGSELGEEKLLIVTMSFPHALSGNPGL
jgi:hypothetical protein